MFVSSSRYNNDISALRDESQGLLVMLDALKSTMTYAIYSNNGQCTHAFQASLKSQKSASFIDKTFCLAYLT
ncbi:hypothetical protein [Alteromonas sp. S005]|uniref:hypothetical protein n=1 Tax=Alteromonas sp. S005 TaxID=3117400 RepID=UPI002FDFBC07